MTQISPADDVQRRGIRAALTSGLPVAGQVGFVVFLLMFVGYLTRFDPLLDTDEAVLRSLTPYAVPGSGWVRSQDVMSSAFGPTSFRIVALVIGLVALWRRRFRVAVFLAVGIGMGGLLDQFVKLLTDRPRPGEAAVSAFSSSFPSGHSFGVTVGAVSLVLLLWPEVSVGWRRTAWIVAGVLIVAVGFSRLALAVHHLSDVIAGFGLGLAWVTLIYVALSPTSDIGVRRPVDSEGTVVDPD